VQAQVVIWWNLGQGSCLSPSLCCPLHVLEAQYPVAELLTSHKQATCKFLGPVAWLGFVSSVGTRQKIAGFPNGQPESVLLEVPDAL
jgi:hypothetical protein